MNLTAIFLIIFFAFKGKINTKMIKSHFIYEKQFINEFEVYEYVTNCTIDIAISFMLNNKTSFGYLKKNTIARKSKIRFGPDSIQTTLDEQDVLQQVNNYVSVEIKFEDYSITTKKTPATYSASFYEKSTISIRIIGTESMVSILLKETNMSSVEASNNESKRFLLQFIDDWNDRIY